ncbi:MAG: Nif3-like dinuclear metal center hexameric protein [Bacteriovoracaceae bacterium]|nr:Nif3-like dinuclear metal center hexameric protein [Bacteriovoracaceae bacterium]
MGILRHDLELFFSEILVPHEYQDYGPNGLQIEGVEYIEKIAFAVSATSDSVNKAADAGADCLVVHHGLFWRFHDTKTLTGPFAKRIFPLVKNEINLFSYHLPLDGNPFLGNAKIIADRLGVVDLAPFGDYKGSFIGVMGRLVHPKNSRDMQHDLKHILNHEVTVSTFDERAIIHTAGIITGGAANKWDEACKYNLDAFITGEMSEHHWHESQEAGIHMFAGGHNATERLGIQALMGKVDECLNVQCKFIDSSNPV